MAQFVIYAGRDFTADFTVVSSDGVTPEVLDPGDTGSMSIVTAGGNPKAIINDIPMTLIDADNGLFELTMTAEETSLLEDYVGFQEDGYSPIGNYDGYLEFNLKSGNRSATIVVRVKEIPR